MASKMMHRGPYEVMDEHENCLMQSYLSLQSQLSPPYQLPSQSSAHLSQLNQALLYGMLTQSETSQSFVTHLAAVTSDGYISFVSILLRLVNDSYLKLLDQPRMQLLWLLRQLIELSASDVDTLCLSLLRRIVGGDLSQGNVWLASELLDIMQSNWGWLTGNPGVLTNALFTYLRILPDHHYAAKSHGLNELRQKEITFCVQVLRDCFGDCLVIGRDLVRLLQDVACIPEFESVWRDLLSDPTAFKTPLFADIAQLYVVRTPTRYLASRLTPEMESQIRFMLTHVRWGSQRRYQTWFAQRFLSTPESETLVCDLIRFICCVHHPTNQILQSDIVSRWAIVGWLIKCCKSNHVEANAKLALFYDWLFFMSKTDNIMNIEPAILLMVHSIPKYIDMTHSLLEFLFLLIDHYDPSRRDLVHRGVVASMDILVGKGVIRSLEPLSAANLVAPWLREKLITYFPVHCKSDHSDPPKIVKHELLQQEPFSMVPNSHVSSIGKTAVPATQLQPGTAVTDPSFVGSNSQGVETVGIDSHELKMDEVFANAVHHKRRRLDTATVENLVDALAKSQETAVTVLEKLLISFLYGRDHRPSDRNKDLMKGDIFSDTTTVDILGSIEKFVRQVTDTLKSGGYDLFSSLTGNSSTALERDEIMSPTSAILRLYVETRHPQMLQMLLFWHRENYAIGPRLLNYACRLAEGLGQSGNADPQMSVAREIDSLAETVKGCSVRLDGDPSNNLHGPRSNSHQRDCQLKSNGEVRAGKAVAFAGPSPLVWHMSFQTDCIQGVWKEGKKQDPEVATDVQTCYQSAVTSAFGAYEQYLREVRRKALVTCHNYKSIEPHILQKDRLENGVAKVENMDAEDEGLESVLLADLEMCLIWNVHRLLTVFPWIFKYLAKSCLGKEEILRFLVSVLNPAELSQFELKLSLREISVMGGQPDSVAGLIRNSLQWDCFEQQYLWRLLIADLQFVAAPFAIEIVKCCTSFLVPSLHSEAMSGLLLYLKLQRPTVQFVLTLMSLPEEFGRLAAAVLASWVVSDVATVFESLNFLIELNVKNGQERSEGPEHNASILNNLNTFAVSALFNFFEIYMAKSSVEDDKMKGSSNQIKHALLQLAGICVPKGTVYAKSD